MSHRSSTPAALDHAPVECCPSPPQRADSRQYRLILVALLVACLIQPLLWAIKLAITPEVLFPDFFGLWSSGRYVLTHVPSTVYDDRLLHAFQVELGMPADIGHLTFFYPPWVLMLLAPLGALPYGIARVAWLVLTFAAYVVALTAWRWRGVVAYLLFLAPSSAVCFLVGQNGFLTAALMLGGMRLLWTRPMVAGILLASLGYKPQFAILVPFVMLFGCHWRALASAGAWIAVLSLATTLAFGTDTWGAWLTGVGGQAGTLTGGRAALLDLMPTVLAGVLLLGGSATMAHAAQAAAAFFGLVALWKVRTRQDIAARAVLPVATILATPYAFDYDLPMATGAILAVIAVRIAAPDRLRPFELPLLFACVVMPAILPAHGGALAAMVPIALGIALWILSRKPRPPVFGQSARSSDETGRYADMKLSTR